MRQGIDWREAEKLALEVFDGNAASEARRNAIENLFEIIRPLIYAFLWRWRDPEERDDVTQEVMARILQNIASNRTVWDPMRGASLRTWIHYVVNGVSSDYSRRRPGASIFSRGWGLATDSDSWFLAQRWSKSASDEFDPANGPVYVVKLPEGSSKFFLHNSPAVRSQKVKTSGIPIGHQGDYLGGWHQDGSLGWAEVRFQIPVRVEIRNEDENEDEAQSPELVALDQELDALEDCLSKLAPSDRYLLELYDVHDENARDTHKALGELSSQNNPDVQIFFPEKIPSYDAINNKINAARERLVQAFGEAHSQWKGLH